VFYILLSGMYLVAFGQNIGMEKWHWGLVAALSSLVFLLQPVSAYMVGRVRVGGPTVVTWANGGSRKSLWFISALVGRLCRGLAIAAAYGLLGTSESLSRTLFITLLTLATFFDAIAVPPWLSWLADIIPNDEHGRFWGRRSAWISLVNILVVIPIGYIMDRVHGGSGFTALLVLFGFALVMGLLDLWIHRTIPEPPMRPPREKTFWEELSVPLRDKAFQPWLVFNLVWTFGVWLGAALAWVYIIEDLNIKRDFCGGSLVVIVVPMMVSVLAGGWLGRLVDRIGVKRTLLYGHWMWALLPLFWVAAAWWQPLIVLGVGYVICGIGIEAALNAGTKLVTRFRPSDQVPMYSAVSTAASSVSGAAGSLLAGFLLQWSQGWSWRVIGLTVTGFHLVFLASFVLRTGSTWLIRNLKMESEPDKV
jgi:MFS family permease